MSGSTKQININIREKWRQVETEPSLPTLCEDSLETTQTEKWGWAAPSPDEPEETARKPGSSQIAARPSRLWNACETAVRADQRLDGVMMVMMMNSRQMNYRWGCWLKSARLWWLIDRLYVSVSPRSLSWWRNDNALQFGCFPCVLQLCIVRWFMQWYMGYVCLSFTLHRCFFCALFEHTLLILKCIISTMTHSKQNIFWKWHHT